MNDEIDMTQYERVEVTFREGEGCAGCAFFYGEDCVCPNTERSPSCVDGDGLQHFIFIKKEQP